jgi:[acyl-carrier-protein] S-malonyltransferase
MYKATEIIKKELEKLIFKKGSNVLISNITADEIFNADELKDLLVKQIENRVRWRESVINMINKEVDQFIEIGPGKVLSGLVKRINKEISVSSINNEEDIKNIKI